MSDTAKWLSEQWADRLGPAISAMTGQSAIAEASSGAPVETGVEALIWKQPLDVAAGATLWVCIPQAIWHAVGSTILSSAGLEDAEPGEVRGTFLEVLQQSLSPLATDIGGRVRREVSLRPGESLEELPADLEWHAVAVNSADAPLGTVWIASNDTLRGELDPPEQSAQAAAAGAGTTAVALPPGRASRTLDLLMEVELPVSVSFGRAQMRLKDAIKLTTGSIVELNRNVNEPVEIIVNNCVIARGEVVVVEGNYGVRIRHIISREERLRTLF